MRISALPENRFDLFQLLSFFSETNLFDSFLLDIHGKDLAFNADLGGKPKRKVARTTADVCHAVPRLQGQRVKNLLRPLPRIARAISIGFLPGENIQRAQGEQSKYNQEQLVSFHFRNLIYKKLPANMGWSLSIFSRLMNLGIATARRIL